MGEKAGRPYLGNPTATAAVLNRHQFSFQKKYGQNFLIDANILERIVEAADISGEDFVLEIGPGIGTMTQYLCAAARQVAAVEIDRALIPVLEETLSGFENVKIINEDILRIDLVRLAQECNDGRPIKVVANLPYYITTPIIMGLFESGAPIESITVMVQREVAERMRTGPGSKAYGALSLTVQYYAETEVVAYVPPNCFIPRPGVGSAVIRLVGHQTPPVRVADEKKLFALIRASFQQRRKTLVNGLKNDPKLALSRDAVEDALRKMGKPANVRGEALTLEEFAMLSNLLS